MKNSNYPIDDFEKLILEPPRKSAINPSRMSKKINRPNIYNINLI